MRSCLWLNLVGTQPSRAAWGHRGLESPEAGFLLHSPFLPGATAVLGELCPHWHPDFRLPATAAVVPWPLCSSGPGLSLTPCPRFPPSWGRVISRACGSSLKPCSHHLPGPRAVPCVTPPRLCLRSAPGEAAQIQRMQIPPGPEYTADLHVAFPQPQPYGAFRDTEAERGSERPPPSQELPASHDGARI